MGILRVWRWWSQARRSGVMGFAGDNLKGSLLAVLSSGFIGASYVIMKKGLRRAADASGVRAGVGGHTYLLEPLWWVGTVTMVLGEVVNFAAYAFAPAVLVAPLGALNIIVSAVLAHFILKEQLDELGILGIVVCIAGSVVTVIHAPEERAITSIHEIWSMATQTASLIYVASVVVLVFVLVFHLAPRHGHKSVLVYIGICSLLGSLSVMSVKALGTSLRLTIQGQYQYVYPQIWLFVLVLLICVITQMDYLNKALDTFNTAIVSPIYYAMFTTLTILASIIMFKDWNGQSWGSITSEICGFIVVISGTILLHATKDQDRRNPSRSVYTRLSPSLSTRPCGENRDSLQHVAGNVPSSESILRIQDQW